MKQITPMRHNLRTMSGIFIVIGVAILVLSFGPLVKDEVWFYLKELKSQKYFLAGNSDGEGIKDSVFARYLSKRPVLIEPVNKEFSIVIERIGVNAPVVSDVSVTDKKAYIESLKNGVAHASVSKYPSKDPGNVYLFAHASVNFWRLGKYATVFNLLRKLDMGDRIYIFYKDSTYIYETVNKEVYKGWNIMPLTRPVIEPILTLQTCDPPGTTLNRMVVTAKLIDVLE